MEENKYKTNRYYMKDSRYMAETILPGILSIGILLLALFNMVSLGSIVNIWLIIAIVCFYNVFNSFLTLSNPKTVMFSNNEIIMGAGRRQEEYDIPSITSFNVREFPSSGLIYMRINPSLLKGRYWIKTYKYEEGKELFTRLRDIDFYKNPDSLKSYAAKTSIRAKKLKESKNV